MRYLNEQELVSIAGGEDHSVVVVDPIAAVQTFALMISVTDRDSFMHGSVVTGMCAGALSGGFYGYGVGAAASGVAAGCLVGLGGALVGTVAGGLAFKGAAYFGTRAYDFVMS